jgi:hypothetical protein
VIEAMKRSFTKNKRVMMKAATFYFAVASIVPESKRPFYLVVRAYVIRQTYLS